MPILQYINGSGWSMADVHTYIRPRRSVVNELTTALASYAHKAWSGWMKHMFESCGTKNEDGSFTITASKVKRWTRQMNTDYKVLPASEQLSDIDEAHEIIAIFDEWTA